MLRFGLKYRTCLVTGGTKGIGKAIVEEFCALGAQIFTCARNEEELSMNLNAWKNKGFNVQGCIADVSIREDRVHLIAKVHEAFGGQLHVLVNNVGTNVRKPTVEYTDQEYQHIMSTNLESAYHLTQLCHPLLKRGATQDIISSRPRNPISSSSCELNNPPGAGGDAFNATSSTAEKGATQRAAAGSVVLFNSSVAGGPTAMWSGTVYAMTKAALNQLTRNLACEWAADGIRVNSVAPWYTATSLAYQVLQDEKLKAEVLAHTPMKRIGLPEEVASVMSFLAGPGASFVTGQTIAVDGGYSVLGFYRS
ncbi:hypothetical protein CEUSTIGMA_g1772.t1 [Chlamydomonas eustigma]|uniref:Tropinone reductase n=1 Tax=Chlamydomonas eustigma TaxID=1157962 RepID=A0A250WU25_9CHLO|nr:hypothetical protein CEUSTIGMA_g1772.t1 [Chlamydomonas eustigma]|eukprot:GAX74323.1 hypothetical protein CEUSTIGMA_g1772.t1 [Chlamydomonas eustigma]